MSKLDQYSIEELTEAIERKKQKNADIQPLSKPDYSDLYKCVVDEVNYFLQHGKFETGEDFEHFCFEEALKAIYGDDIFDKLEF